MTGAGAADGARYRAFISYSHKDAAFANRLHRRLEGYTLPRQVGGRRLSPVFKDREELPAAHDLSVQVRAALADSGCLIVICSPDAAASPWVGREIEIFKGLHPDRPILAALLRGDPGQAFPPALAADGLEPLAADFRKSGDGKRLALLKLAAGIAQVGVDQLVQRDAQRQLQRVTALTVASLAAVVAMGALTAFALTARTEAVRQRAEAEKLVEFMLTDLRGQLKAIGRLPVMKAVNRQAFAYYSVQDIHALPPASLQRRARLLHSLGDDQAASNDLTGAKTTFDEAWRVTGAMLEAAPENPDRLFAHGQSAYWRGYIHYLRGNTRDARAGLDEYRELARRLARAEPGTVRSLRETAYAEGSLCTLALQQEKQVQRALALCEKAMDGMLRAQRKAPSDPTLAMDVATRWAGLADVQVELKDYAAARRSRLRQADLLGALLEKDPENAELLDNWGVCHRGLSFVAYRQNDLAAAKGYLKVAQSTFSRLSEMDPSNQRWREQLAYANRVVPILDNAIAARRP